MFTFDPASSSAASWLAQRQELAARLEHDPSNAQAWYWRARIKLMSFLLTRYGNAPPPSATAAGSPSPPLTIRKLPPKPPRPTATFRVALKRIATANVERWVAESD